jgi:hypothetical protein
MENTLLSDVRLPAIMTACNPINYFGAAVQHT